MKTKSLYPIIVTEDIEASVKYYGEVFGYKVRHSHDLPNGNITVLENGAGCEIELMKAVNPKVPMKAGLYGFRMNVDNIEEAAAEIREKGIEIVAGPIETEMGVNLLIRDNNGVNITLIEHRKKA